MKLFRFLALGDSYTIGEGVSLEDNWPGQLTRQLRKKEVPIAEAQIIAQTGWTTSELQAAIEQAQANKTLKPPYDLVSLGIGVNNQYRGLSLEDYTHEFQKLLEQALSFAGDSPEKVLVLSIPDWSVTPYAAERNRDELKTQIHAFNRVNARAAYQAGVVYINVTEISRKARYSPEMLVEDKLHYSRGMYRFWVQEMLPKVWRSLMPGQDPFMPLSNDWIEKKD